VWFLLDALVSAYKTAHVAAYSATGFGDPIQGAPAPTNVSAFFMPDAWSARNPLYGGGAWGAERLAGFP
jgi:hypothetical protein